MTRPTMHFITPTYRPAGGVVKMMDYATHALDAGYDVAVICGSPLRTSEPLFEIARFVHLPDSPSVTFSAEPGEFGKEDIAFISLPTHYAMARAMLSPHQSPDRIIHAIQGVRHTNPEWLGGLGLRTLARPASRISINSIVGDLVESYVDPRGLHRVINLGHELDFFATDRDPGQRRETLRVGYTAWKSDLGDRVMDTVGDSSRFEFRGIRETVSWDELRRLYQWADVFLSTPGPEEGLYLPGLEAMAAGALVVTPDVGGNMAYCEPGINCLLVGYESIFDYVTAIERIAAMSEDEIDSMRQSGKQACAAFDLGVERREFHQFLEDLVDRALAREHFGRCEGSSLQALIGTSMRAGTVSNQA